MWHCKIRWTLQVHGAVPNWKAARFLDIQKPKSDSARRSRMWQQLSAFFLCSSTQMMRTFFSFFFSLSEKTESERTQSGTQSVVFDSSDGLDHPPASGLFEFYNVAFGVKTSAEDHRWAVMSTWSLFSNWPPTNPKAADRGRRQEIDIDVGQWTILQLHHKLLAFTDLHKAWLPGHSTMGDQQGCFYGPSHCSGHTWRGHFTSPKIRLCIENLFTLNPNDRESLTAHCNLWASVNLVCVESTRMQRNAKVN